MVSHARALLLLASAIAVAAVAGAAAVWVNARERALDERARRAHALAARGPSAIAQVEVESVSMHFDKPHVRSLPVELAALGAARFHTQAGHPELAVQQIEGLFSRVPEGGLQSECTAELAIAQCALGKRAEGEHALRELAKLSAPAALIARAQSACQREASAEP